MTIKSLEINQFRNLSHISIEPKAGFNLFTGKNGSGKTSVLEAIHCLGRGKSFRTHKTNSLICNDTNSFTVVGKITHRSRDFTIGMQRQRGHSDIRLAGKSISRTSELAELLPIAVLDPSLHRLIEEGSEGRRNFLDWGVFHVEPAFKNIWYTYRKVLAQRNAALKAGWSQNQIRNWDYELVKAAENIDRYRQTYLQNLTGYISKITEKFTGVHSVSVSYYRGWRENEGFFDYLQKQYHSDKDRGFTQYGPHRADLRIKSGQMDARDVLSRGQQKILVASLILAQCQQLIKKDSSMVILVDDLPAELDEEKRQGLLEALEQTGAQIFITATDLSLFTKINHMFDGVFHVKHGHIVNA